MNPVSSNLYVVLCNLYPLFTSLILFYSFLMVEAIIFLVGFFQKPFSIVASLDGTLGNLGWTSLIMCLCVVVVGGTNACTLLFLVSKIIVVECVSAEKPGTTECSNFCFWHSLTIPYLELSGCISLLTIFHYGMQIALVPPLTSRDKCSVPTVGKLRKVNGFMLVVVVPYLSSTWMIWPMMKSYMIWATPKW